MIHGEFGATDPYPWVRVFVYLDGVTNQWKPVRFLLDTGAGATCLHPADALSMGIPSQTLVTPASWPASLPMGGVGGSSVYFPTRAYYLFPQTDGSHHLVIGQIMVAQARPENMALPSLLGWDVLDGFRLNIRKRDGVMELDPITPNIVQVPQTP